MSLSALVLAKTFFMRLVALLAVLLAQPGLSALAVNLTVCVAGDCDCAHEDEVDEAHASTGGHSGEGAESCCGCHPHWLATPASTRGDETFAWKTPSFAAERASHPRAVHARVRTDDHPREMMRPPNA